VATDAPTIPAPDLGSGAQRLAREAFAAAARRLAEEFGAAAETAVGALGAEGAAGEAATATAPATDAAPAPTPGVEGEHPSLYRPGQLRRRLAQLVESSKRYEQPFALVVFDVEGPGAREGEPGGGRETALAVTGAALGQSVRLVDETFRLEEDALCVLAPSQTTVGGVQMAERLLSQLDELEAAGGLRIGITAGVVACPEHGGDADTLLHKADEAMWRARAVGQPVGVGSLQDR
jgi:GGDEF domain-containing protein